MHKLLLVSMLCACGFASVAQDRAVKDRIASAKVIVWTGLDYSMLKFVGTSNDIKVPGLLLQDMPQKWNDLFLDERLEGVANTLGKTIEIDLASVTERNKGVSPNQIIFTADNKNSISDSGIKPDDVARIVRSYKLRQENGVGLVFLIDRIVVRQYILSPTPQAKTPGKTSFENFEAIYVVFFDIATREIISSRREVSSVNVGGSFRNYWFGPIKNADLTLANYH